MDAGRVMGAVALCVLAFGIPGAAAGEGAGGVGVVTTLGGEATVARVTLAEPLALRLRDDVLRHDRISTQAHSLVRVLLRNKALLTVRELSVLTLTDEAARATVQLKSGKVSLAVVRRLMGPGEQIELRTPNAIVAVRGTVVVVEIVPTSPDTRPASNPPPVTTRVHLLRGEVDVALRNSPSAAPVHLTAGQTLEVSGDIPGPVRSLSPEAIVAVTASLAAPDLLRPGLPAEFLGALLTQQQTVASVTHALTTAKAGLASTVRSGVGHGAPAMATGLVGATGSDSGPGSVLPPVVPPLVPPLVPTELLTGR